MKRAGASITWILEHVIKEPKDYRIVGYIFKNMKIYPDYQNYIEYQRKVGDKGYAAAFANLASSPMHHIMKEFLDATKFYLELYDHPKELQQLSKDMEPYYDQIYRILADSPAEVIFAGGNYDEMITYPPFFRDHILPYLQKFQISFTQEENFSRPTVTARTKAFSISWLKAGWMLRRLFVPNP
jgi:hypothetical protein